VQPTCKQDSVLILCTLLWERLTLLVYIFKLDDVDDVIMAFLLVDFAVNFEACYLRIFYAAVMFNSVQTFCLQVLGFCLCRLLTAESIINCNVVVYHSIQFVHSLLHTTTFSVVAEKSSAKVSSGINLTWSVSPGHQLPGLKVGAQLPYLVNVIWASVTWSKGRSIATLPGQCHLGISYLV